MIIKSVNPRTEEVIAEFVPFSNDEIANLVSRAKLAQKVWANKSKKERISVLLNVKKNVVLRRQELVDCVFEECGFDKQEIDAVVSDVLDGFDYYCSVYEKRGNLVFPVDEKVFPETSALVRFFPLGVVGLIGIWNFPFWQTMISAIPALLTGNAVVFKPSEKATKSGLLIADIINSSEDFPEGVFVAVVGGPDQGRFLVKSGVDAVVYTGNIRTGEEILRSAGVKPVFLELSGNDAAVVCSDCDLDQAVSGVVSGAFLHSGEVCDRIKRVYVVKAVAEQFISGVVEGAKRFKETVSPLISLDALHKVESQVGLCVDEGAEVLVGGKRIKKRGFYFEPTVLRLKDNDVESVRNEIFGPVLSVLVVDDEDEAVRLANDCKFGLGASVWTQDFVKASRIADSLDVGMVWVNDSNFPLVCGEYFRGWKLSGIPSSSDRLSQFLKSKVVLSFKSRSKRDWWF